MACCGKARKLRKIQQERREKLQRQLVKDPTWKKLRETFNGQWKDRPEWCCSELKKYLGIISRTPNNKLGIVITYLSGSGFSGGRVKVPCIRNLFTDISKEINKREAKKEWQF